MCARQTVFRQGASDRRFLRERTGVRDKRSEKLKSVRKKCKNPLDDGRLVRIPRYRALGRLGSRVAEGEVFREEGHDVFLETCLDTIHVRALICSERVINRE